MRYLCIEMKALHQFRKTLTAQSQGGRGLPAVPSGARERGTYESLFELEPCALQRFVR